jgi:hypothetical protein
MQLVHTSVPPTVVASTAAATERKEVIEPQVHAILDRSCADCHSDRTNWPWYSHVAPVSWIISKHVTEARQMLDFSEWTARPVTPVERLLICNAVSNGRMPLPAYTAVHQDAKLSKLDVKTLCDWAAASKNGETQGGIEAQN